MTTETVYRVGILDDHELIREGLEKALGSKDWINLVFALEHPNDLEAKLDETPIDLLILDLGYDEENQAGFDILARLKQTRPEIKVLILTQHNVDWFLQEALRLKADGFFLKEHNASEIPHAIELIRDGKKYLPSVLKVAPSLTGTERRVLELMAETGSPEKTAKALNIRIETVYRHTSNMYIKFGIQARRHSRRFAMATLIQKARDLGLIGSSQDNLHN